MRSSSANWIFCVAARRRRRGEPTRARGNRTASPVARAAAREERHMRRNFLARALGVLALLAVAIFIAGMDHTVRAATHADATISGVVVNGTHNNAPIANQQVTLQEV